MLCSQLTAELSGCENDSVSGPGRTQAWELSLLLTSGLSFPACVAAPAPLLSRVEPGLVACGLLAGVGGYVSQIGATCGGLGDGAKGVLGAALAKAQESLISPSPALAGSQFPHLPIGRLHQWFL